MLWRYLFAAVLALAGGGVALAQPPMPGDLNEMTEKALKEAAKKVAPCIVQIQTQGGSDMVVTSPKGPVFRKAMGPTTGVIVSPDGYIVSSAFNFINNPSNIVVGIPGHKEPFIAKKVATDKSRLVTLLKIEASNLPVPQYAPRKEVRIGQWSAALGRALDLQRDNPPSVSLGIVSALNRIWGKAVQTDCKVSPVNYGGPLVDLRGRVIGILIPASPQGEDETAGYEWYDSGIGFAVPMEDVLAAVPRLKLGKDLKKGLLGVRMKSPDIYSGAPEIGEVTPQSSAAKAGLKTGDVITEINGKPLVRMAQLLHELGPHYEGDTISLKYRRGKDEVSIGKLQLVGALSTYTHPFLGILPVRDDPKLGVEVRFVYPKSPAEAVGIKAGDRVVKYGKAPALQAFRGEKFGRLEFTEFLNTMRPGEEVKLEVARKEGKPLEVTVKLDAMPGTTADRQDPLPAKVPARASAEKALDPPESPKGGKPAKAEPPKKAEKGYFSIPNASKDRKSWIWVHEDYDPNVAHALLVWLHPPKQNSEKAIEDFIDEHWLEFCSKHNIIFLAPTSDSDAGWVPGDGEFVQEAIREVMNRYTIDRQRVILHGLGVGGQMAIHQGFQARDLVRGVATTGAVVGTPKDNLAPQRLSFFLAAGDRDPLVKEIAEGRSKLVERGFPVVHREIANIGRQYLNEATLAELARWIDQLDRQ